MRAGGGCLCGEVRYEVEEGPSWTGICHCSTCKRASGGAFAAFASFPRSTFRWSKGAPCKFQSSAIADRFHCGSCGTPLAMIYKGDTEVSVYLGSLNTASETNPDFEIFSDQADLWVYEIGSLKTQQFLDSVSDHTKRLIKNLR